MSEPTLAISYTDILTILGYEAGYGRTSNSWDTQQAATIQQALEDGQRMYYFPAPIAPAPAHQWSWLKPTVSLTLWPDVAVSATVTVTISGATSGIRTVTATGGTPFVASMVGSTIIITDVGSYEIVAYTSTSEIIIAYTGSAPSGSTKTFSIASGNYQMPDDYGGIEGVMTFSPDNWNSDIAIVPEGRIRRYRADSNTSGIPAFAAIRPKQNPTSQILTQSQRHEMMVYPKPDQSYDVYFKQVLIVPKISALRPYPYGGAPYAQFFKACCCAALETLVGAGRGPKYAVMQTELAAAIVTDTTTARAEYYGRVPGRRDDWGRRRFRARSVTHDSL